MRNVLTCPRLVGGRASLRRAAFSGHSASRIFGLWAAAQRSFALPYDIPVACEFSCSERRPLFVAESAKKSRILKKRIKKKLTRLLRFLLFKDSSPEILRIFFPLSVNLIQQSRR